MHTRLFSAPVDETALVEAACILKEGGLVVFPTETVYGLGAHAFDEQAVRRIFEAKGRPLDNPLIVHIADTSMLPLVTESPTEEEVHLFTLFSPGPLTVVCKKHPALPLAVTANLSTVGIRIPTHPLAQRLLTLAHVPVAAPSANLSGRPSPTTFAMAVQDMEGRVDAILDGGDCEHGLESTVVMVEEGKLIILRPGAITEEMLLAKGFVLQNQRKKDHNHRPLAPGIKYTHYKPHAEVWLTHQFSLETIHSRFAGKKIALVGLHPPHDGKRVVSFSNIQDYAKHLFSTFVALEKEGIEVIILEAVEEKGLGKALMNRMRKASGDQWLEKH